MKVPVKEPRAFKPAVIFLLLFILAVSSSSYSQNTDPADLQKTFTSKVEIGAEYLVPTRFSDQIRTVSAHAFFWKQRSRNMSFLVNAGITTTYARGYTRQYDIRSDTLFTSHYKTSAAGIGPVIQLDYAPIKIKRFSLIVEASGGLLVYSNRFPYGGDIYNFMFRTGPSVAYRLNNNCFLKTGYRWMHVSNGKGYGRQNPFYEAQGVNISLILVK